MDFIMWLQRRLNAHGANLTVDGDWGRRSIRALRTFQETRGLPPTGTATQATVQLLKDDAEPAAPTLADQMPPWLAEMHRRSGLHEVRDNAALSSFLKIGRYLGNPANLPWCGDAVESCIAKTLPNEALPANPFFAQSWATFGHDAKGPLVGSIGVIRWSATAGHVGFVARVSGSTVYLLGGNQSNAINITGFARSRFIAFRWPVSYPVVKCPPLTDVAPKAGAAETR